MKQATSKKNTAKLTSALFALIFSMLHGLRLRRKF